MPVIALTQEMGSLAKDVALRVAALGGLAGRHDRGVLLDSLRMFEQVYMPKRSKAMLRRSN